MADKNNKLPLIYCFLDTNILHHFQMFDEVNWTEVLNAKQVCLVIAPTVLRELNQHKDDYNNERRRNRARMLLSKLKRLLEPEMITDQLPIVRRDVSLMAISQEPSINWIEEHLDPNNADDRLIASILEFSRQRLLESLLLVTNDFLLRLKARDHNIKALPPDGIVSSIESTSPGEDMKQKQALLKSVATLVPGVNISLYRDTFGNPVFINPHAEKKATGYVFVTAYFYLEAVADVNGVVKYFSLTIRDKTFNPTFRSPGYPASHPSFQITLGKSTFANVPSPPQYIVGSLGAHNFSYYETRYFGNPGYYEYFGFGLNEAGYLPDTLRAYIQLFYNHRYCPGTSTYTEEALLALNELRSNVVFNTYAVSAPFIRFEDYASSNLGVSYSQVRTLNIQ